MSRIGFCTGWGVASFSTDRTGGLVGECDDRERGRMVVIASAVPGLLVRSALVPTDSRVRALGRAAATGDLVRIARGVYVEPGIWAASDRTTRHLMLVHAVSFRRGWRGVVSHQSAAAMHGWPRIGPYPGRVQALDPGRTCSRSSALVRWHAGDLAPDEVVEIDGLRVTGPLRTLRDVLVSSDRTDAVAVADFALRRGYIREADAVRSLELLPPSRGSRCARDALAFADPEAESPGESYSRVVIDELGFPPPRTQVPFRDAGQHVGRVDFWWPGSGVIGEFDGRVKYSRGGSTGADDLFHEKQREDALRRIPGVEGMARWTWDALEHPDRLAEILLRAGLHRR